jgi:hypothetical protein
MQLFLYRFLKIFPLKPLGQMNRHLVGSIYGRSSVNIACFLPSFGSFGLAVSEKNFKKSTNQKQESPVAAMFVNGSGRNEQYLQRTFHRCFLPSVGSFGQAVSVERFLKICIEIKEASMGGPL